MKTFYVLSLAIFCLLLASCTKDEETNSSPSSSLLTSPLNHSFIVGLETSLSWKASTDKDGDKVTYDVYLGTETNPTTKIITNSETTSFNTDNLQNNSTYYWKVTSKDADSEPIESEIWSFRTNAILGNWKSDTIVHPQYGIKFVQSHTFDEDGSGTITQTGGLSGSYDLTWTVDGNLLSFNLIGTNYKDTVYHAFENNGNTMIFKESEVTPDVEARLHRIKE